jgi:NitT/TauT family transport system permease protein
MQSRWLNAFFRDAVLVGVTTPGLVWALITAIVFGNRPAGPLLAIVLTTFALITVNVSEGIKAIPTDLVDMSTAFRVGLLKRNRHIIAPHLAPYLFTGIRFGFSIAWKVTVLTEVFASSSGIGFQMRVASQLFRVDEFLTWILAFYLLALFLEKIVLERIERHFFRWRQ